MYRLTGNKRGRVAGAFVAISAGTCFAAATALAAVTDLGTSGGVNYLRDRVEVTGPSNFNTFVACPGDKSVTGGGFSSEGLGGRAFALAPEDSGLDPDEIRDDGWNGIVALPAGTQDLDVYAICSNGQFSYRRSGKVELNQSGTKSAKATCGSSRHVVGGGGYLFGTILDAYINSSYPTDSKDSGKTPDDGWKVRVYNEAGSSLDFRAFAICAGSKPAYRKAEYTLPPGSSGPATPGCGAADHVLGLGGRVNGPAAEARLRAVYPRDGDDGNDVPDDGALVNASNDVGASTTKTLKGFAICG